MHGQKEIESVLLSVNEEKIQASATTPFLQKNLVDCFGFRSSEPANSKVLNGTFIAPPPQTRTPNYSYDTSPVRMTPQLLLQHLPVLPITIRSMKSLLPTISKDGGKPKREPRLARVDSRSLCIRLTPNAIASLDSMLTNTLSLTKRVSPIADGKKALMCNSLNKKGLPS